MSHPLIYTAPYRLGPLPGEDLRQRLFRSRDYLATHLDQPVCLEDAARAACLSQFHYHRLFTRAFGETPHAFLTKRRIEQAKRLLARDQLPVTEVCMAVGYESLGTFSARFRAAVGSSPSDFRRSMRVLFVSPGFPPLRFVPGCFLRFFLQNSKIEEAIRIV